MEATARTVYHVPSESESLELLGVLCALEHMWGVVGAAVQGLLGVLLRASE